MIELYVWNVWRMDCLVEEFSPIDASQPRMSFYFFDASVAQPVFLPSPQKFVNEIACLMRPSVRNVSTFDVNFLRHHILANLPPISSLVRSLP